MNTLPTPTTDEFRTAPQPAPGLLARLAALFFEASLDDAEEAECGETEGFSVLMDNFA